MSPSPSSTAVAWTLPPPDLADDDAEVRAVMARIRRDRRAEGAARLDNCGCGPRETPGQVTPPPMRWIHLLPLPIHALLGGCVAPTADDPRRYAQALTTIQTDPLQTQAACSGVEDADLRGDCLCAGAEALAAAHQRDAAAAVCATVPADSLARDECWFMVAERTATPSLCAQAGRFGDDCRLHLLQQTAARHPEETLLTDAPALIAQAGFAADDPRPWTLLYRHRLSQPRRLDLSLCSQAPSLDAQAWCRRAGLGLLQDRLNYVRDARVPGKDAWCAGEGPLPSLLEHTEDPEIAAILAERTDVCAR